MIQSKKIVPAHNSITLVTDKVLFATFPEMRAFQFRNKV